MSTKKAAQGQKKALTQTRKGGCTMELNEVLALLTIIGGTAYATFQSCKRPRSTARTNIPGFYSVAPRKHTLFKYLALVYAERKNTP